MNYFDLTGKVAVVTGASSGLGKDAALAYAKAGAKVVLLARRKEKLDAIVDTMKKDGYEALAVQCDVTDEDSVKKAIEEAVAKFGRIDILLNNAGSAVGGSVEQLTTENWNKSMDTNVKGAFLTCKYVVPIMREQKYGKIVNIASVNAVLSDKSFDLVRHSYNASKAAVVGLTRGMAASYMQFGITVNAVGPGLFESEMTEGTLFKHEGFMKMYSMLNPASRAGNKGELNGTILYLSSDASSYVTGSLILVDGGLSLV